MFFIFPSPGRFQEAQIRPKRQEVANELPGIGPFRRPGGGQIFALSTK